LWLLAARSQVRCPQNDTEDGEQRRWSDPDRSFGQLGASGPADEDPDTWPPLFADSSDLPESLDPSVFSVAEHPSGEPQLAVGGWPLYHYAADAEPGDVNGQGVGGNWFAVAPDGSLIRSRTAPRATPMAPRATPMAPRPTRRAPPIWTTEC